MLQAVKSFFGFGGSSMAATVERVTAEPVTVKPATTKLQETDKLPNLHQSRWGFHPVSYEDFLLLKAIHKRHWAAIYRAHTWQRWAKKLPKNRHGSEPGVDLEFIDVKKGEYVVTKSADGTERCHWLKFTARYRSIVADFREARTPRATAEECGKVDMGKWLELARRMETRA